MILKSILNPSFLNSLRFSCAIILAAEILEMTERPSNSSCLAIAPLFDGLSVICKKSSRKYLFPSILLGGKRRRVD